MPKTKTILVIDDQQDVRTLVKWQLLALKYQVLEAGDGPSAMVLIKQEQPDLILLDLMMPKQDGLELYRDLRQEPTAKDTPVIFLTSLSPGNTLTPRSLELFALSKHDIELEKNYTILGKPFEPEQLIHEVRKALGEPRHTAP